MPTFRIVYANNLILSCTQTSDQVHLNGEHYFEQDRGRMIFAILNAKDEEQARQIAAELQAKVAFSHAGIKR